LIADPASFALSWVTAIAPRLWRRKMKLSICLGFVVGRHGAAHADDSEVKCRDLPTAADLRTLSNNGASASGIAKYGSGLFRETKMWAALVNPSGELCAFKPSTAAPRGVWPGSQAIAKAKADTANSLSLDDFALATARLHTFTQPGRSLNSLGQSNRFNPEFLAAPSGEDGGKNQIARGLIFFGARYRVARSLAGWASVATRPAPTTRLPSACATPRQSTSPAGTLAHDIV
jgi:hypothetical protein